MPGSKEEKAFEFCACESVHFRAYTESTCTENRIVSKCARQKFKKGRENVRAHMKANGSLDMLRMFAHSKNDFF